MGKETFAWPNNARIAFVLGIAFECWDQEQASRAAGRLQSPLPANALCKRDYSTETFRDFGGKVGVQAAARYLRHVRSEGEHADQWSHL